MQLKAYLTALAVFTASVVSAKDIHHTVAQLRDITENTKKIHSALDAYNGGLVESIKLASVVHTAHKSAVASRKAMQAFETFSDDDAALAIEEYRNLHDPAMDTLRIAQDKAPAFRDSGFAYIAQAMLYNWYGEKSNLRDIAQEKFSNESYAEIAPVGDAIDKGFLDSLAAFHKNADE